MKETFKHLALGIFLILVCSAILLISDMSQRRDASADLADAGPASGKWHVHVIKYMESPASEQSEAGVYMGLKESGLVEGEDYEIHARSAQGDIATLRMIVDAAITANADMIIPLSTPTLQTVIKRIQDRPVVFTHIANPVLAGAGKSDEDHIPNITGAYNLSDYEGLIRIVRQSIPGLRRVGTLFTTSELNSRFHRDNMIDAGKKLGVEVITVGVNTVSEVTDAAMSMCEQGVDAICQIADNLCDGSFATIAQVADRTGTPLAGFSSHCSEKGAFLVLARDFEDTGREAGMMAAAVMRGADTAGMPFKTIRTSKVLVNLRAAKKLNITIPESIMGRAEMVIQESGEKVLLETGHE
jgi:ABC-type uncharacterized transport system substrate-binding protein